jgi:hypothetical protein
MTWLSGLFGILGIIIGYFTKIFSDLLIKHQERRNNLEKIIIEKRLAGYEPIISMVRSASLGIGTFDSSVVTIQPYILNNLEGYYEWYHKFLDVYSSVGHLIDRDLDYKLWLLQNYLYNLERVLNNMLIMRNSYKESNEDIEKVKNYESTKLIRIGEIVYPDMRKLTTDILEEASKFFSSGIYRTEFTPSTIRVSEYSFPEYFTKLALFSRGEELQSMARFQFPNT